jgi:hypothetical protein
MNRTYVKDFALGALAVIVAVVLLCGLGWLVQGTDFILYRHFAPRYEQARRETYEQSKAYRQGMAQELQSMRFQYEQASPEHQDALRSIILHRAADVEPDSLPVDLQQFIEKLKGEGR